MKKLNLKGFSLVELLVVITIIAILSVVAYTAVGGQTSKARDAKRKEALNNLQTALEIYFIEKGSYPATLSDGTFVPKYIPVEPKDVRDGSSFLYATANAKYQIATTLEDDGTPTNFKAYVVGNGTNLLGDVVANQGVYMPASGTTAACTNAGAYITNNPVCTTAAENAPVGCSCLPYDPR